MPERLEVIQKLIENSCAIRRSGIPNIELNPEFYSLELKGGVSLHANPAMASVSAPSFIFCYLRGPHDWKNKMSHELVAIVDIRGNLTNKIDLSKVTLSDISLHGTDHIKNFKMHFNDYKDQHFDFEQATDNTYKKRLTFSQLWEYCKELNENCETAKEGIIYLNYFLSNRDSQEKSISLKEYEQKLLKKKEIIDQYEYLLEKFQEIVEKSDAISKIQTYHVK